MRAAPPPGVGKSIGLAPKKNPELRRRRSRRVAGNPMALHQIRELCGGFAARLAEPPGYPLMFSFDRIIFIIIIMIISIIAIANQYWRGTTKKIIN